MLTSFPELSVGKRGSRVYWILLTHGLHPAVISSYSYLYSLCQPVAVVFVNRTRLRVGHFIYLGTTHNDTKTINYWYTNITLVPTPLYNKL